jgi:phytoene synthase
MGSIYRALLDRLVAADWRDIYEPVAVPKWRKMWLAFRHGFL